MNPVAMTIINPRKEYWPSQGSNQQPPVLKSARKREERYLIVHILLNRAISKGDGYPVQAPCQDIAPCYRVSPWSPAWLSDRVFDA